MSFKLLIIVIIAFKRYPRTYCLMQGICFICSNFWNFRMSYLKIRITSFKFRMILCLLVFKTLTHLKTL